MIQMLPKSAIIELNELVGVFHTDRELLELLKSKSIDIWDLSDFDNKPVTGKIRKIIEGGFQESLKMLYHYRTLDAEYNSSHHENDCEIWYCRGCSGFSELEDHPFIRGECGFEVPCPYHYSLEAVESWVQFVEAYKQVFDTNKQ